MWYTEEMRVLEKRKQSIMRYEMHEMVDKISNSIVTVTRNVFTLRRGAHVVRY